MYHQREIKSCLTLLKDYIGRHLDEWDVYRVLGNPYDRVYAAQPSVPHENGRDRKAPASRAFYKLVEIVKTTPFLSEMMASEAPLNCAYAGEAPGSFVECVVTLRRSGGHDSDTHTGMSLRSENRTVPHWKLSTAWMKANGVTICRGADGTGDMRSARNAEAFVEACGGAGSCDLVTGDGGFDFSSDFNDQEALAFGLLASECHIAVRLLKRGGACVIKVFDAFNDDTKNLLASFAGCFERFDVRKPKTSRPGNSERYIVCGGFEGASPELERAYLSANVSDVVPPPEALERIESANLEHGLKQVRSILGTIDCMDRKDARGVPDLSGEWLEVYSCLQGGPSGGTAERTRA